MNCVFHPTNLANARCSACERPLCPACDHRIKGIPCCQDCIVIGIESLRRANEGGGGHITYREEKSPLIALLLGLVPGVGAAYNGQNIKALTHFLAIVGLWVLADIFGMPLEIALGFGSVAFYFYSIYDAFQSAQCMRRGEDLSHEDERLKLFLQQHMNLFGALLISVGAVAMLDFWIPHLLHRLWPVVLIAAGGYLLVSYYHNNRKPLSRNAYRTPPPSAIQSGIDSGASEFVSNQYRER